MEKDKICSCLENLKTEYEKIRQKFNLPSWREMNEEFEIEKLQDKETETLIREVRRAMLEKSLSYLKFIEMFMNPGNAPMFFLALVRNLDNGKKKILDELYLELGKYEILSVTLDNEYNEEKEAEFINKFFNSWKSIKSRFKEVSEELESSWDKKSEKKEKGYLG